MDVLVHDALHWYGDLMDNKSGQYLESFEEFQIELTFLLIIMIDPRVKNFFLLSSPLPTLGLCIFYAYFSKSLGPRLMANRKPMDLRKVLVYYNAIQTIFSAWIFYEVTDLILNSIKWMHLKTVYLLFIST